MAKAKVGGKEAKIVSNLDAVQADASKYSDGVLRYALLSALTSSAQAARKALIAEMGRVFDNPTRYTLNSLTVDKADKETLTATLRFKDGGKGGNSAGHYLVPQAFGGARPAKRYEQVLRRYGRIGPDELTVVAPGAADENGNLPRGQVNSLLAKLKPKAAAAPVDPTKRRRKKKKPVAKERYFVGAPGQGKAPHGIYWTKGRALRNILTVVSRADYSKRLPFYEMAHDVSQEVFAEKYAESLERIAAKFGSGRR